MLRIFIYYLITNFIRFAVSITSMSNNAYFIQCHFNLMPFTYNNNIVGCFINMNKSKLFWRASRQLRTSVCYITGLDLHGLILFLMFDIFCQPLLKSQTYKILKIPKVSIYQTTIFFKSDCLSIPRYFLFLVLISFNITST